MCCKATASSVERTYSRLRPLFEAFEPDCFMTEGVRYRDAVKIPAKKRLKPNAIPTIFPKPDGGSSQPTTPSQRPASERRKRKAVSI